MKHSKLIAVLLTLALLFDVAQPALAASNGEEASTWSKWGTLGGIVAGVGLSIVTGGAALPFIIGGAAIGGATGYAAGAIGSEGRKAVALGAVGVTAVAVGLASSSKEEPPRNVNQTGLINIFGDKKNSDNTKGHGNNNGNLGR